MKCPRQTTGDPGAAQVSLLDARVGPTAPCVPAIREAVSRWRAAGYKGSTDTTRAAAELLVQHRPPAAGRTAFATTTPSVRRSRRSSTSTRSSRHPAVTRACWSSYATNVPDIRLLQYDDFARYCIKMATGSGKTKVMSLAVAWQYFNAVAGGRDDYATHLPAHRAERDRLRAPAGGLRRRAHLPHRPGHSAGTADLLGLRLLHARRRRAGQLAGRALPDQHPAVLRAPGDGRRRARGDDGRPRPEAAGSKVRGRGLRRADRRPRRRRAWCSTTRRHHTHDEESEWNKVIRRLHERLPAGWRRSSISSATPRYSKGRLFPGRSSTIRSSRRSSTTSSSGR